MELTGWYAGLIMASMCFLYMAGIVMGFAIAYLYMIFKGARDYLTAKKRMDEALVNLGGEKEKK